MLNETFFEDPLSVGILRFPHVLDKLRKQLWFQAWRMRGPEQLPFRARQVGVRLSSQVHGQGLPVLSVNV